MSRRLPDFVKPLLNVDQLLRQSRHVLGRQFGAFIEPLFHIGKPSGQCRRFGPYEFQLLLEGLFFPGFLNCRFFGHQGCSKWAAQLSTIWHAATALHERRPIAARWPKLRYWAYITSPITSSPSAGGRS